jgi:AraC family transcriptional activator of tynA and feaB
MPWVRLGGHHVENAKLCFRFMRMRELWVGVTVTSSSLAYQNVPTAARGAGDQRTYTLLMPNRPRHLAVGGNRYIQQTNECVLTDSDDAVVGAYSDPHAAICLNIPSETVHAWLPSSERLNGLRLGTTSTSSRTISLLLLSLWLSIEGEEDETNSRRVADALLALLARNCRRAAAAGRRDASQKKIDCKQVMDYIDGHVRDPNVSVQTVAERIGVTTRYLQLLFAEAGDCISEYIKRERLRGCLLDLRDANLDQQSITEIAFSWGFNSAAHFSSSFKKEFGLSPRDYRSCETSDLASSALADVEGPLVQALIVLERSLRDGGAVGPSLSDYRPAVVYG